PAAAFASPSFPSPGCAASCDVSSQGFISMPSMSWGDLCRPSLTVWSEANNWALVYHHEEFMQFGKRQCG
ncbi:hypothetical protein, partial [Acidovorax sp. SUPP2825]|uniref:hypothetical protein n=1 Tax=Acidovorax sp. SUPP2825 TaxID=2920879 RepID=UPI0024E0F4CD